MANKPKNYEKLIFIYSMILIYSTNELMSEKLTCNNLIYNFLLDLDTFYDDL
jgi:hypothetical protein